MDILDTPTLTRLAEQRGGTRISLFLPTHRGGPQTDRNRIRLKNLLRLTQGVLRTDGMRTEQIDAVLAPAHHLLDRLDLRGRSSDGLALFLGPDESHHFRVPLRLPDLAVIGDRFVVRPLLPLLTADGHFYVMTLSQDEIHLLRGTRFGLEEMELEGLSLSMWLTMPRGQPQVHAFLADRGGTGARAVFHGGDDDSKSFVFRHFQRVDHAVRELFGDGQAPLVLAGVRFLQAMYHQTNTYPHLLNAGVDGSPREMGIAELHRRVWPLVEPVLRSRETAAAAEYRTLQGTGRTSNEPADVLTAARQGRVETLFLSTDMPDWLTPVAAEPLVRLDGALAAGADLDLAAVSTLRHAGNVYAVTASRMPGTNPLAAILRY